MEWRYIHINMPIVSYTDMLWYNEGQNTFPRFYHHQLFIHIMMIQQTSPSIIYYILTSSSCIYYRTAERYMEPCIDLHPLHKHHIRFCPYHIFILIIYSLCSSTLIFISQYSHSFSILFIISYYSHQRSFAYSVFPNRTNIGNCLYLLYYLARLEQGY